MRPENKRMQQYLASHGLDAIPKYISTGSLKGSWRLYNGDLPWSQKLAGQFNALGFTTIFGQPLDIHTGNGGLFSIFVRGHNELLHTDPNP